MKKIRYYQNDCKLAVMKELSAMVRKQLVVMPGGCHARGTPILMYDGSVKSVENIIIGDILMGNDSTPRNVISLARGNEIMYEVFPIKGMSFIVNENHILSLKRTGVREREKRNYPEILNISIKDYLNLKTGWKRTYNLYRTGVDFGPQENKLFIDPYVAGIWIADGTMDRPEISKPDIELYNHLKSLISVQYPELNISRRINHDRCPTLSFTMGNVGGVKNRLLENLRRLVIDGKKRIPPELLCSSRENRLLLLAGLLDGDGYLSCSGFEISTKDEGLKNDILFLCRSLGFAAYSKLKKSSIKSIEFEGYYHRIFISGNCDHIPTIIPRKKASKRFQKKDVLVSGFKIEKLENGDYYGFSLDGNHLYCMGDFTVTHNTGKTFTAVNIVKDMGRNCWIAPSEELINQAAIALIDELGLLPYPDIIDTFDEYDGIINIIKKGTSYGALLISKHIGVIKADAFEIDRPYVVCSAQTLYRRLDRIPADWFRTIVTDEADLFFSRTFKEPLEYFKYDLLLGLTATPFRADGVQMDDIFDKIVYEYEIGQAIKDGFLCELNAIVVKTSTNLDDVGSRGGDFIDSELAAKVNTPERNNKIVSKYIEYCSGQQFIAFCANVAHAIDLHDTFTERGLKTAFVVSDKSLMIHDRADIVKWYRGRELDGLVNVGIFSAGFDAPNTGCVILGRPTKSKRLFLQQLFRVTRLKDEAFVKMFGQIGTILDIVDGTSKHKLVNTHELDKELPIEDRVFTSRANKQKLIDARNERLMTEVKEEKRVVLFPIPKVRAAWNSNSNDALEPLQIMWLKSNGYDVEQVNYTRNQFLTLYFASPAGAADIVFLKDNGYDVSEGVSIGEAENIKRELKLKQAKENTLKLKNQNKL